MITHFRYRAARSDGAIVVGVIPAASTSQATELLTERGLFTVGVLEEEAERRPIASRRDLAIAFQSIAALVSAGVPLEKAIGASEHLTRGTLRDTLIVARTGLREGKALGVALASGRGVVPEVVLGMIRAGERGSQLGIALNQVATLLEQEADLVERVRQALLYPLLLAVVGTASVLVIGTVVVPRFAEVLRDIGQQLPLATRMLLAGSSFISHFWILLIGLTAVFAWAGVEWVRRPAGRRRLDEALLSLPAVGRVRLALATARVTSALGGMLRAGIPLLAALDAAGDAAGDVAVAARLKRARERVSQGAPIAASLEREGAISTSALQLVAVGESSGRLGEMTLRAGNLAAQEAERGLRTVVTILEPTLIVAFGIVVAFVAAALLQAVYSLRPGG